MPVWTVSQRFSPLQWRRLFKELWGRPTTTADFGSPFWQVPYTSNLCLLEDKVQDRGMHLFKMMQWIKEVELVDSVDELRSSLSFWCISTPNFEVIDARIASALNKIIHNSQFKRRISLEEQKAQKEDRFLYGRQIAYMIYDYFRVTGANDSVDNYADLFTIGLRNDDIQEFDSKRDGIYCRWLKANLDDILERLYKLRIRESENLKTVLELYDQEIHQKKLGPDYHRLKTMVKRSTEQEIRNKNFGNRIGNFEKNAVVKNQGTKQCVQRILGDCWQWETNGQCVKEENCSFRHDINKRGKVTPSNPSPNSFMQLNERKSSRTRSPRRRSPSGRMSRWPCKDYLKGTFINSFCKKWHPPECLFYKTKSGCRFGEKCSFAHRQVDEQPTKRSKKNDGISAVAMLKKRNWQESVTDGCHDRGNLGREVIINWDKIHLNVNLLMHDNWVAYFRTWRRRKLFSGSAPTCRSQSNVWNSQRLLHVIPKFETKILR